MTAWFVHFYTASGAICAFLAITRIFYNRYQEAFFWLGVAIVIDATDGLLARRVHVKERLPHFNGPKLDDIVDYLTYVFVPAFLAWHALLLPEPIALVVVAAILLSSAYGFNRDDAKTEDHLFTGFPSYWNLVVFYLFIAQLPEMVNAGVLLVLAALVFVPIRYVYPSRTTILRGPTNLLGAAWGAMLVAILWTMPDVPAVLFWASFAFPVYYFALSLYVTFRRRTA